MFKSSVRSKGDLAGVFECDSEACYFYLYDQTRPKEHMIVDHIRISERGPDFQQNEIFIRWDESEKKVGLLIRGQVWAIFDTEAKKKHGGTYVPEGRSPVPAEFAKSFTGKK